MNPIEMNSSPDPLADPSVFPLVFKKWLIDYVSQEIQLSKLPGYVRGGSGVTIGGSLATSGHVASLHLEGDNVNVAWDSGPTVSGSDLAFDGGDSSLVDVLTAGTYEVSTLIRIFPYTGTYPAIAYDSSLDGNKYGSIQLNAGAVSIQTVFLDWGVNSGTLTTFPLQVTLSAGDTIQVALRLPGSGGGGTQILLASATTLWVTRVG